MTPCRSNESGAPACFTLRQWAEWKALARTAPPTVAGYCEDCCPEYQLRMKQQGRCANPDLAFSFRNGVPLPQGVKWSEQEISGRIKAVRNHEVVRRERRRKERRELLAKYAKWCADHDKWTPDEFAAAQGISFAHAVAAMSHLRKRGYVKRNNDKQSGENYRPATWSFVRV